MRTSSSGKVNLVGLVMLLGLAGGIYYVVMFSSVYLDSFDVSEAVAAAFNQAATIKDERIIENLKAKLDQIGTHRELNEDGELVETTGLGLDEEAIVFERRPDGTVLIQVDYVREVRLKPTQRWAKVRFSASRTGRPK